MPPLHLKHYIYIFIALSTSLFLIFGYSIHLTLSELDKSTYRNSLNAANVELDNAVGHLIMRVDSLAKEIAEWDEVHQQLYNPNYYDYWKAQRLNGANLPSYLLGLEIYDEKGFPLSDSSDPVLPEKAGTDETYLYYLDRKIYLVRMYPISSRTHVRKNTGFIGLKIDLIKTLVESGRFMFINADSLNVKPEFTPQIIANDLAEYIEFEPVTNSAFHDMQQLVYSALEFGAFMVTGFLIALYIMIKIIIIRPVSELSKYVEKLQIGKQDRHPLKKLPIFELDNLRRSLDVYQNELESAYKSLDIKNDELWQLAHHDPLTGIANRRAFDKDWKSHLTIAADRRMNISLMLIDCDHFKAINDTYGHDVGDQLIKSLSHILQSSIREGDRLYRIGGDEFVTILWNTDEDTAEIIAERCLRHIRSQRFECLGIKEPISISIGLSHKHETNDNLLEALPRQADIAMYHAKKTGNRSIVHYEPSLEKDVAPLVSNRILDAVIRAAEKGRGIVMHYQPVVQADGYRVDYYEALVRIQDDHGMISASEIFPVVERLSLQVELDIAIIRHVTDDVINGHIPEHTGVSINLSSASLTLPSLSQHLERLSTFTDRQQCILEVTETTLISNINSASLKLSQLRTQGFKVALDDFGSGYSSIRYLASMPIDIVKFDISMIKQLAEEGPESVISGTAGVILNSGYRLVAEGIEDERVRDMVISMGATHLQGFLLGRPKPVDKL